MMKFQIHTVVVNKPLILNPQQNIIPVFEPYTKPEVS